MLFYYNILKNDQKIFENRPCSFPYVSMVLDYNGDLKNCFYSRAFGNLYHLDSADWTFKSLSELKENGNCKTCRGKIFCPTGKKIANPF